MIALLSYNSLTVEVSFLLIDFNSKVNNKIYEGIKLVNWSNETADIISEGTSITSGGLLALFYFFCFLAKCVLTSLVQVAKLLSDTSVLQLYPTLFVLATEILDMLGDMVWERIRQKAEYTEDGTLVDLPGIALTFTSTTASPWPTGT